MQAHDKQKQQANRMAAAAEGGAAGGAGGGKNWLPIESNPEVMNAYLEKLGFPTSLFKCYDVMSTEEWALEMVPAPTAALLMLYPIKEASEAAAAAEAARVAAEGQVVDATLYYSKQTIPNACGTVGLLHAVANLCTLTGGDVELAPDSFFARFVASTLDKSPEERAVALEADDSIDEAHDAVAHEGQSAVIDDTYQHFVALVRKGGHLYELDGRKATPINHGATTPDTFLTDAIGVVRGFMDRDPGELRFTMVALAPNTGDDEEA